MVAISEARCPDYPRFVYSALLLIFSCVVTFYAIIEQKTNFFHSVPGWAALLLFLLLLFWLGLMEGLQVQSSPQSCSSPVLRWLKLFV